MCDTPSKKQMLECLKKSGYLLEGRLVRYLNEMGLFVEPCQSLTDERTGISREIDIIAESYRHTPSRKKTSVITYFVIEAVNNLYPVVLLTPRVLSPSSPVGYHLKYKVTPSKDEKEHPFLSEVDPLEVWSIYNYELYSQYCAFTRKKNGDLMASHPDDLHTSIQKVVEFSMHSMEVYHAWMDSIDDDYWRIFIWRPLIVFQNDLVILRQNENGTEDIVESGNAKLEYNFHHHNNPETIIVDFVTESALPEFIKNIISVDDRAEELIFQIKSAKKLNNEQGD